MRMNINTLDIHDFSMEAQAFHQTVSRAMLDADGSIIEGYHVATLLDERVVIQEEGTRELFFCNPDYVELGPVMEDRRQALINALIANDPNGCYGDKDSLMEFGMLASVADLEELAADQELDV